jgi:hypothetical protein
MRKVILFVLLMAAQAACGDSPSGPGSTTTTGGTTGNPNAAADFTVTGTPCVAPAAAPVSCTFNASASGGTGPFTFDWLFTNPNGTAPNNQVPATGAQTTSPILPCGFSSGVVSFNVTVQLTAKPATGTNATVTRTQSITRAPGACGT